MRGGRRRLALKRTIWKTASGDRGGLALAPRPLFTFAADQADPEFGGDFGLWPQQDDCRGDATFVAGEDAEAAEGLASKHILDFDQYETGVEAFRATRRELLERLSKK